MSEKETKVKRLNAKKRDALTARIKKMKEEGVPNEINGEVSQSEYLRSVKDEIISLKEMGFSFEAIAKQLSKVDDVEISASTIAYAMKSEKCPPKVAKSRKKKSASAQTEVQQTPQESPAGPASNTASNTAQAGNESGGQAPGVRKMAAGASRHEDKTDPFSVN